MGGGNEPLRAFGREDQQAWRYVQWLGDGRLWLGEERKEVQLYTGKGPHPQNCEHGIL